MTSRKRFCLVLVTTLLYSTVPFVPAAEPSLLSVRLSRSGTLRGLKIPLAAEDASKPQVKVWMDEVLVESRRVGFLRIGALPEVVVKGMKIESVAGASAAKCARLFAELFQQEPALMGAEFRGVQILTAGRLIAASASGRFNQATATLILQQVDVFVPEGEPIAVSSARLQLAGDSPGSLIWDQAGGVRKLPVLGSKIVTASKRL